MEHVPVGHVVHPFQVVHVFHALDVHGQTFQAVRDFYSHRFDVQAAHLLEVRELGDFHAIQPDFPAHAPGPQGRGFPVIFYETDIVFFRVNAQFPQAFQVQLLDVGRGRFHDDLELVMLEQSVRVVTVTAVRRTTGRFYVAHVPGFRPQYPQECGRVHGAGAFFNVVGLSHDAFLLGPVCLQVQDDRLKIHFLSSYAKTPVSVI